MQSKDEKEKLRLAGPSAVPSPPPALIGTSGNNKDAKVGSLKGEETHGNSSGIATPGAFVVSDSSPASRERIKRSKDKAKNVVHHPVRGVTLSHDGEAVQTGLIEAEMAEDVDLEALVNERIQQMVVGVAAAEVQRGEGQDDKADSNTKSNRCLYPLVIFVGLLAIAGVAAGAFALFGPKESDDASTQVLPNTESKPPSLDSIISPTLSPFADGHNGATEESPGPSATPPTAPTGSSSPRTPTVNPSTIMTPVPTKTLTRSPAMSPTPLPTPGPTRAPTPSPTTLPTPPPTPGPTRPPTPSPTMLPTPSPTPGPTKTPTANPTPFPSTPPPTQSPTKTPTSILRSESMKTILADYAPWHPEAIDWLAHNDTWEPYTGDPNSDYLWMERYVLAELYYSTNGANWTRNDNWLSEEAVCRWHFLHQSNQCPDGPLRTLWLQSNQLTSSIPSSLGSLTKLTYLSLYDNQLTSSIPQSIADLSELRNLYLHKNQLTSSIPASIGSLEKLEVLSFAENQLTSSIPSSIENLSQLTYLSFADNKLISTIPSWIGELGKLQYLSFGDNHLTSTIPSSIGDLTQLTALLLYGNFLSGSIPVLPNSTIGNCWLSNNCFQDIDNGVAAFCSLIGNCY